MSNASPPSPDGPFPASVSGPDTHRLDDPLAELDAIYRTAPVGLAVLDRDLRFRRINERLAAMNRASVEAHLGRSVAEMVPDLQAQAEAALRRVIETGEPLMDLEIAGPAPGRPDDIRQYVEHWHPVFDATGTVVGVSIVADDVTDRRRAQALATRREREMARMADNAPAIIARYDRAHRHVFVNRAVERVTGRPATDFIGRTNRELGMPDGLCATWEAAVDAAFAGESRTLDFEFEGPDGPTAFQWRVVPETDEAGRVESVLSVAHEVTALRRTEAALREADRRKDEFLAMLAHELRNPLAPIVNAARVLVRETGLSDAGRRALAMIDRQARQMGHLVDDLLEVNRIARGTIVLRPAPLDLAALVTDALDAARPAADAKGQHLAGELPADLPSLHADPVRLGQVLENLLSNAVKYTPAGGRITVSAAAVEGQVEIRVRDDGIGIQPDKLESVFDLFVQAEPGVGAHQGGLGIGLAMVRRLVDLHGGTVHAESEGRGRGACFVVRLPATPPAGRAPSG